MHDSLYESNPTHPLGAHESWPKTGPVYDVPVSDEIEDAVPTVWQRLTASAETQVNPAIAIGSLPVWY